MDQDIRSQIDRVFTPNRIGYLHEILQRDKENKDGIEESEPNTRLQQPPSTHNRFIISPIQPHITTLNHTTKPH